MRAGLALLVGCLSTTLLAATNLPPTPDPLARTPAWQAPGLEKVRAEAFAWLEERKPDAALRKKAEALWADVSASSAVDRLGKLAATFALVDDNARRLVALCSKPAADPLIPSEPWLSDPKTSPLVSHNLRLLFGAWLAQQSMFEEAKEQLGALKPADVVDPASLLFYQSVIHHQLLDKEAGQASIRQLLDGASQAPERYRTVARMMQEDLKGVKEETLDHIARRMADIRRRLELGRSGKKVLAVEDGVIASLDKLIKELEDKQKQQQQQSTSSGAMQPSRPAQDSQIMEGKGPGEVDPKRIGSKSGWGDLPPRQRDEAMQQIGREFPAHYRDLIEQYFRKLATEGSQ